MTAAALTVREAFWVMVMPYRGTRVVAARVCNGGLDLMLGNSSVVWVSLDKLGRKFDLSSMKITDYGKKVWLGDAEIAVEDLLRYKA